MNKEVYKYLKFIYKFLKFLFATFSFYNSNQIQGRPPNASLQSDLFFSKKTFSWKIFIEMYPM